MLYCDMTTVLQEKNLSIILSKNFMYFEWTFQEEDMKKGNVLKSSKFRTGGGESSFLEMNVNEMGSVYLNLHNPKFVSSGHYIITIYDNKKSVVHNELESTKKFCNSAKIDLLIRFRVLPESTSFPITIACSAKSLNTTISKESNHFASPERLRELSLDFKKILDEAIDYDIGLKAQEENIKAHKAILRARSPVFNKMFNHVSSELAENAVVISDVGASTMKRLVTFLYTGTMEKCDFDEAVALYYAADKYEVLSLREDCKAELLSNINANKACFLFALANRHSDEVFLDQVVQFICENFESAVNADSFDELSKEDMKLLTRSCARSLLHF